MRSVEDGGTVHQVKNCAYTILEFNVLDALLLLSWFCSQVDVIYTCMFVMAGRAKGDVLAVRIPNVSSVTGTL